MSSDINAPPVKSAMRSKRVLIVGGSSGIGAEVARQVADLGAAVMLVARDAGKLESVANSLRKRHVAPVDTQALDATNGAAWGEFCRSLGPVDHVVSMVGGAMGGGFLENTETDIRRTIEGKFFSALQIARAIAPNLREGGSLALTAGAGGRPHSASGAFVGNAAIGLLVQGLAVELAPRIRVNAVAPTWMDTPLWRNVPREQVESTKSHFSKTIPLGRTAIPAEVASAYVFAMLNGFITGQVLVIDGGLGLVS